MGSNAIMHDGYCQKTAKITVKNMQVDSTVLCESSFGNTKSQTYCPI